MSDLSDGLHQFEVDLTGATEDALPNIKKAIGISALKGKRAWQDAARGHRYLKAYVPSIDYDPVGADFSTELGPNLGGRGAGGLGIVEDSPGGVRGRPQRNYVNAEKVIEEDLPRGVQIAIDQALREVGL